MSKLPNEIRLEIVRKLTANVWKIEELLKTIKSEIEARETREAIKAQEVQGRKHNHGLRKFPPTANALVSIQGKDFNFNASIAVMSIIQPLARRSNYRKIERKYSRGLIAVLFASKQATERTAALR